MTRNEIIALAAGAAVIGVLWWQSGTGATPAAVQGAVEGITWRANYPPGHEHLALPSGIGTVLWGPHPIYCDQRGPGKYRDPLIARGWADWIADPPSEETI
jgi:hypothetical protein